VLARTTARGRDRVEVGGPEAQGTLDRGHAAEALVEPETRVVGEEEGEPSLEVGPQQGRSRAELRDRLQGQEKALDEGDGTRLADGPVAMTDSVLREHRGTREKTSKTTASLKEKRRRRPGISVTSIIQTWFG